MGGVSFLGALESKWPLPDLVLPLAVTVRSPSEWDTTMAGGVEEESGVEPGTSGSTASVDKFSVDADPLVEGCLSGTEEQKCVMSCRLVRASILLGLDLVSVFGKSVGGHNRSSGFSRWSTWDGGNSGTL